MFYLFKKIINTKITFKKLEKNRILLFNDAHSNIFEEILNIKKYCVLKSHSVELNFWILVKQILKFDFNTETYYQNYIRKVSPKVVITFVDNDIIFFKLKKKFNSIKFIAIQNGIRKPNQLKVFDKQFSPLKYLSCDYFLIFNKHIKLKYKNYINANYILLGSFRNNLVKTQRTNFKKSFLYISQFRMNNSLNDTNIQIKLIKYLNSYFVKHNLKINILLQYKTYKSYDNQKYEIDFFKKYFKSKCSFINSKNWKSVYKNVDMYENIIFLDSTLGYEAISRKKKVAVFSLNRSGNKIHYFGWPSKIIKNPKTFFYCAKKFSFKETERVLNNIYSCNQRKWEKEFYPLVRDQLNLNRDNQVIKNLLNDLKVKKN